MGRKSIRKKGAMIDHPKTRMLPECGFRSPGEVFRVSTARNGPLGTELLKLQSCALSLH